MKRAYRGVRPLAITFCIAATACTHDRNPNPSATNPATGCPGDNAGLALPNGFCATIFADNLVHARHVAVASNGDVYVSLEGMVDSPEAAASRPNATFAALRDTDKDGRADIIRRIGEASNTGNTGIGIFNGYLYVDEGPEIVRYARADSQLVPGRREVVVRGIPLYPQHIAHNFAFGSDSSLYVNLGSASNACQVKDRHPGSPGRDPCDELRTRAGIWRYRADKLNQGFSPAGRFATGLRNGLGLAVAADGKLYATQHGRDQLHYLWIATFPKTTYEIENPGEELMQVNEGDDFGWPFCYYAMDLRKRVDAPEYGGDGVKNSRCADKREPVVAFPAHWAPMSLLFYSGTAFPERYRHGAFIAFHGSGVRPAQRDVGFRIVFQPLANGAESGLFETFAQGFAGPSNPKMKADTALHRPAGLAMSPDGAIIVTDDAGGRIYRITYRQR